jgi:hypothetical protein
MEARYGCKNDAIFISGSANDVFSPLTQADEQVVCDCYIKDDKTACAVDIEADAAKPCACVKETMYGKRKFKEKACVAGESSSN